MSRLTEMSAQPTSTAAELSAVTESVERAAQRVGQLTEPYLGGEREDIVAVMYEAERQLIAAGRALQRALRTLNA
jgi:hypothetical protein